MWGIPGFIVTVFGVTSKFLYSNLSTRITKLDNKKVDEKLFISELKHTNAMLDRIDDRVELIAKKSGVKIRVLMIVLFMLTVIVTM